MFKDFLKKIQNLEENERRHLFVILIIVSTAVVFVFWLNQIKSIFENQTALAQKKPSQNTLPSIKENLKSSVNELGQFFSGFNNYLKSQIISESEIITPLPSPTHKPTASLPPAMKLPDDN